MSAKMLISGLAFSLCRCPEVPNLRTALRAEVEVGFDAGGVGSAQEQARIVNCAVYGELWESRSAAITSRLMGHRATACPEITNGEVHHIRISVKLSESLGIVNAVLARWSK